MKRSSALTAAVLAASATGLILAQNAPVATPKATTSPKPTPAPTPVSPEDAKAIDASVAAFVKAFNAGDVKGLSALFTENAEVTDENGGMAVGRPAISSQFEESFRARPGQKLTVFTDAVRFFSADVAQEEGRAVIVLGDGGPEEHSRYSVIYVKKDGQWLQASVRDDADHTLSPHEHLKPLAWMVGEWVNETQGLTTHTTCQWTPDQNYLIRDFTVHHEGKPELSGTQRIGWDPLTKHIKSWVFDSEGGFGEGQWSHEAGRWVVKATGVLPDGATASATYHISLESKDLVRWQSVDRVVAGKPITELEEITLVRKPPKPQTR